MRFFVIKILRVILFRGNKKRYNVKNIREISVIREKKSQRLIEIISVQDGKVFPLKRIDEAVA